MTLFNTIHIEPNFIYFITSNEKAEHLGAVWNQKMGMFRLPNTIGALRDVYKLLTNEDDKKRLAEYAKKKIKTRDKLLSLKVLENVEGDERLRPYQRVDVNYLKHVSSAGIFNEQRTGKTPTTLVLVKEKGFRTVIIVVPATLILQWQEEVEKWTDLDIKAVYGLKKKRMKLYTEQLLNGNGFIVSYETLRNDLEELIPIVKMKPLDALIVDEAHRLRSLRKWRDASKQSKAVYNLGKYAKHRYALTGTPTVKGGDEIYGILTFLYPNRFTGYYQFVDRYFNKQAGYFGGFEITGYKRKEELEEILALISTNRKRDEVMKWLPAKQYQKVKLKLEGKQKKVYDDVATIFEYEEDGELKIDAPSVLAQLTRMRQITTAPEMLDIKAKSVKEQYIMEWLENNPNEPVVIFSVFSSYLKLLEGKIRAKYKGYNPRLIIGEVPKPKRDKYVKEFQAGKSKIILANIKAAGVGLTLDRAETVIFLDKEYNPADNEQAEDRIVPVSEERNHSMQVISLVCEGTVDEMIEFALSKKINITSVVNNGGINGLKRLMKEDEE